MFHKIFWDRNFNLLIVIGKEKVNDIYFCYMVKPFWVDLSIQYQSENKPRDNIISLIDWLYFN